MRANSDKIKKKKQHSQGKNGEQKGTQIAVDTFAGLLAVRYYCHQ
jgi:hypothetical protein